MKPFEAEKLFENQSDEDIIGLGKEVERFIREDANLTTAWVRTESRFGATKFSAFKKLLSHLSFTKFKNLTRALYRGNPKAFERWYHGYLWELLTKSGKEE